MGPIYCEEDLEGGVCPWCIESGEAARKWDATFVDTEAFTGEVPEETLAEIVERTPGFATWQGESWPVCCGDATAFLFPAGSQELRAAGLEGFALEHIIYEMGISGGAAVRLLDSLHRDAGPSAYVFRCSGCLAHRFAIDRP